MKVWVSLACILAVAYGWEHQQQKYHGPQHIPVIYKGVPIETPEVQHAKQAHFAALSHASQRASYEGGSKHYDDGQYKHDEFSSNHFDDGQYKHQESSYYDDGQYKHQEEINGDDGQYKHQEENNGDDGQYKHYEEIHYDDGQYHEQDDSLNYYNEHKQNVGHYDNTHQGFEYSLKHGEHYNTHHQIPTYHTTHIQPKIGHDGKPLDTPEVEIAKAKHFAAVHEALTRTSSHGAHYRKRRGIESYDYTPEIHYENFEHANEYQLGNLGDYHFEGQEVSTHADNHGFAIHQDHAQHYNHGYYTYEQPQIGHDGKPLDTAEVELAKQAHFAAHNLEKIRNVWAKQGILPYEGLADTPEVEHAKAAHFAAYAKAAAKSQRHHH